jgi:hypothetical protein
MLQRSYCKNSLVELLLNKSYDNMTVELPRSMRMLCMSGGLRELCARLRKHALTSFLQRLSSVRLPRDMPGPFVSLAIACARLSSAFFALSCKFPR